LKRSPQNKKKKKKKNKIRSDMSSLPDLKTITDSYLYLHLFEFIQN